MGVWNEHHVELARIKYLDPPVGVLAGLPHTTYRLPDRAHLGGSWYGTASC